MNSVQALEIVGSLNRERLIDGNSRTRQSDPGASRSGVPDKNHSVVVLLKSADGECPFLCIGDGSVNPDRIETRIPAHDFSQRVTEEGPDNHLLTLPTHQLFHEAIQRH